MPIKLDIEKGDLILVGRYKNKKEVVKTFGKDKNNQLLINKRKMFTFRINKTMPKDKRVDDKTASYDRMVNESIVKLAGHGKGKHSKEEVHYEMDADSELCENCEYFDAGNHTCEEVMGSIDPGATCDEFESK